MSAPDAIELWADSDGGIIADNLTFTSAIWQENLLLGLARYGRIRYQCSGNPDLSGVLMNHVLTVTGFSNADNNGENMTIWEANDTANWIDVLMAERVSNSANQVGASASGFVLDEGAHRKKPSAAKLAQGFKMPEKPSDGHINWLFHRTTQWIQYLSNGGANVIRASMDAWQAITSRSVQGLEWIQGLGAWIFDPTATDMPGEGCLQADSGAGRAFLESAHPDLIQAYMSAFVPEILPPVTASLNFASISAGAVGTLTITAPGAAAGDLVQLGPPSGINAGLMWSGYVSTANTVTIRLLNTTGSPIDPAESTWAVTVTKPNAMPVITVRGLRLYANLMGNAYVSSAALNIDLSIDPNEAGFHLLLNSVQHRKALLANSEIKALIQGSAIANAVMEIYEGPGY